MATDVVVMFRFSGTVVAESVERVSAVNGATVLVIATDDVVVAEPTELVVLVELEVATVV